MMNTNFISNKTALLSWPHRSPVRREPLQTLLLPCTVLPCTQVYKSQATWAPRQDEDGNHNAVLFTMAIQVEDNAMLWCAVPRATLRYAALLSLLSSVPLCSVRFRSVLFCLWHEIAHYDANISVPPNTAHQSMELPLRASCPYSSPSPSQQHPFPAPGSPLSLLRSHL